MNSNVPEVYIPAPRLVGTASEPLAVYMNLRFMAHYGFSSSYSLQVRIGRDFHWKTRSKWA